jgi:hypothetical protein
MKSLNRAAKYYKAWPSARSSTMSTNDVKILAYALGLLPSLMPFWRLADCGVSFMLFSTTERRLLKGDGVGGGIPLCSIITEPYSICAATKVSSSPYLECPFVWRTSGLINRTRATLISSGMKEL